MILNRSLWHPKDPLLSFTSSLVWSGLLWAVRLSLTQILSATPRTVWNMCSSDPGREDGVYPALPPTTANTLTPGEEKEQMPPPGPVLSKSLLVTFCGDKGLTMRALNILHTSQNTVFSGIVFNAGEHTALVSPVVISMGQGGIFPWCTSPLATLVSRDQLLAVSPGPGMDHAFGCYSLSNMKWLLSISKSDKYSFNLLTNLGELFFHRVVRNLCVVAVVVLRMKSAISHKLGKCSSSKLLLQPPLEIF